MALTNEEKAFVSSLKKAGKASGEISGMIANQRRGVAETQQFEQLKTQRFAMPSLGEVVDSGKDVAVGFGKGITEGAIGTAKILQGGGQRVLAGLDPTKTLEEVQSNTGFESMKGEQAQQISEMLKSDNTGEKTGKVLAFVTELMLPSGSRNVLQKGLDASEEIGAKILDKGSDITNSALNKVRDVSLGTVDALGSVKTVVGDIAESASRIPGRIATNVAEKQAVNTAIKSLPTQTAQNAVREGIDIADVKTVSNSIEKNFKEPAKKLLKVVQDFSAGNKKINPIEVVGKPLVDRIKQLESARGKVGQKLGQVAEKLGEVTNKELTPSVFDSLRKVNGLSGLKISKKGILDFTDTVLTTAETKTDRLAIQRIFTDAIKGGSGKSKHLLRQEIFEILGGKKKSLTNLTDTQEKAYNAIRKGLSNVLEGKNSTYKTLSNDYRKIIQPLSDMRKFMKSIPGATEDILDMQAGLLARRLTSNAPTNPIIRQILKNMDSATKVKGKAQLSIEKLQDFYNVLDKYYDIAGKTGFQGQLRAGVEKAGGVQEAVVGAIRDVAGSTQATRTKALENLLNDLLR